MLTENVDSNKSWIRSYGIQVRRSIVSSYAIEVTGEFDHKPSYKSHLSPCIA